MSANQRYAGMQSGAVNGGFEQLVTQHHREIYLYIWRLTRGADEAQDLFQDTFLRAYKAYERLSADANARAWLFKIATNLCRNYFRRQKRSRHVGLDMAQRASHGNGTAPDDPEQHMLLHDLQQHVLALIDGLPLKQKAALIQRKLHGCPYDTIAVSLQCSPEAARAHVFQALKKIRATLALPAYDGSTTRRTAANRTTRNVL
jgi:RNA polymerase sigma-70 factor (ECF subfamily)